MMSKRIFVEELILKPMGGSSENIPPAYCVVIDGRRSPLVFDRRQAQAAVEIALADKPVE